MSERLISLLVAANIPNNNPLYSFLAAIAAEVGNGGGGGLDPNPPPAVSPTTSIAGGSLLGAHGDHTHAHGDLPGGLLHAAATRDPGGEPGFVSPEDLSQIDANTDDIATLTAAIATLVPQTRLVNTTAPLTGGGSLAADLTLGISPATTSAAGSMSATDKAKLDAITSATSAPPEVKQSSELGTSTAFALENHTHQSPLIYWPQGSGATDAIVANRPSSATPTASAPGIVDLGYYVSGSATGAQAEGSCVLGGQDCSAQGIFDVVCGGYQNESLSPLDKPAANTLVGGYLNNITRAQYCIVAGGYNNRIENQDDREAGLKYACIYGGFTCQVWRSAGHAAGYLARSYTEGERSNASGNIYRTPGAAQFMETVISGKTEGADVKETVNLTTWIDNVARLPSFEANHSYLIRVEISAVDVRRLTHCAWIYVLRARCQEDKTLKILSTSLLYTDRDDDALTWEMNFREDVNQLVATFYTGNGPAAEANVTATLHTTSAYNLNREP